MNVAVNIWSVPYGVCILEIGVLAVIVGRVHYKVCVLEFGEYGCKYRECA